MTNSRRFGKRLKTALSIERDCELLENAKVLGVRPVSDGSGLCIPCAERSRALRVWRGSVGRD